MNNLNIKSQKTGEDIKIRGSLKSDIILKGSVASGGSRSTDYNLLDNKPSIEDIELEGNKTFEQLGFSVIENKDISNLF